MAALARWSMLQRRADDTDTTDDDDNVVDWNNDGVYWWYTDTGMIVKWVIFTSITVLFLAWLIGGYFHAKKRLMKGQEPLAYHRVLVSRRMRAQYDPNYVPPQPIYGMYPPPHNGYGQPMYNMPPPVYDPSRPPMYEPSVGGTKVDPMQHRHYEEPEYQPPPGPPPASMSR